MTRLAFPGRAPALETPDKAPDSPGKPPTPGFRGKGPDAPLKPRDGAVLSSPPYGHLAVRYYPRKGEGMGAILIADDTPEGLDHLLHWHPAPMLMRSHRMMIERVEAICPTDSEVLYYWSRAKDAWEAAAL